MSLIGCMMGTHKEVVGVEDDPDGHGLRLYLGTRSAGIYVVVEDPDAQEQVRRAWNGGGRVTLPNPPEHAYFRDSPDATETEDRDG